MSSRFDIRQATEDDLVALDVGLQALSRELGDPHLADRDALQHALFGPARCVRACLAQVKKEVQGIALFSPLFSTARGTAGLFVSDLWVAPEARGEGLGPALLLAAANHASRNWGAGFMRLAVHNHNPRARAFYDRLGFETLPEETALVLSGPALKTLRRHT